jgi:hypothetical protein
VALASVTSTCCWPGPEGGEPGFQPGPSVHVDLDRQHAHVRIKSLERPHDRGARITALTDTPCGSLGRVGGAQVAATGSLAAMLQEWGGSGRAIHWQCLPRSMDVVLGFPWGFKVTSRGS